MVFQVEDGRATDVTCPLCLEVLLDGVEGGCGHCFCRQCLFGWGACPLCHKEIGQPVPLNATRQSLLNELGGHCTSCSWTGTRAGYSTHARICGSSVSGGARWESTGLSRIEYEKVVAAFAQFADAHGTIGKGEASRICRWLNLPSTPTDVDEMFAAFNVNNVVPFRVPLFQFCTWANVRRRDPNEYGLSPEEYEKALSLFHSLDTQKRGFLTVAEAAVLIESSFGQRLSADETASILKALSSAQRGRGSSDVEIDFNVLLLAARSEKDGWNVCEMPTNSYREQQQVPAPTATASEHRAAPDAATTGAPASEQRSNNVLRRLFGVRKSMKK